MSIPVLVEVYDEMRRLAIAGSVVAPGDFRLKKLVPPLEKAGEKAPIFAKVAQAAQSVVESDEKTASAALLELTTLVNAILYTQGETGSGGDLQAIETTDLGQHQTQASARLLKPLLEALATSGSGRLELIRDAFERGMFRDLRLVRPALNALDDAFPDVADFVADNVLPLYGKAILPELRESFDIKGKGADVRRLQLMHQLDPDGARELVKRALDEGSKELKIAAVECLGRGGDDLSYLVAQTKAKAKDVRAAALGALARLGSTASDALTAIKEAIAGADLGLMIASIRHCPAEEIHAFVRTQVNEQFAALHKTNDKAKQGAAISRLQRLLACLGERTDAETEALLLRCFDESASLSRIKSEPSGSDLNELVASLMAHATPKTREQLIAAHASLSGPPFVSALFAARLSMSPNKFYDTFAPVLKPPSAKLKIWKKSAPDPQRAAALVQVLNSTQHRVYDIPGEGRVHRRANSPPLSLPALDPRWLDAALDADQPDLIRRLARPDHPATNRYLAKQLAEFIKKKEIHQVHLVLETMVRIQHPDATEAVLDALKREAAAAHYGYYGYWLSNLISQLPVNAVPKVEALLPSLPEKMVDQLMDALLTLKNKTA
jgi:hypothetical protein